MVFVILSIVIIIKRAAIITIFSGISNLFIFSVPISVLMDFKNLGYAPSLARRGGTRKVPDAAALVDLKCSAL